MSRDWQPIIEEHGGVLVLRDDLYPGGTKARIIPPLMTGAREVVFGGPFCGGAPVALAVVGRAMKIPVTLFYAARRIWHPRQKLCEQYGAALFPVPIGRISKVQKSAREYARKSGAVFFPLGYDNPAARAEMLAYMQSVRWAVGALDYLFLSMGSGMLAHCAALSWPEAQIMATAVGLKTRWQLQSFPPNMRVQVSPLQLSEPGKGSAPFPCDPYYDLKAWEPAAFYGAHNRGKRILFWNVLGEPERVNSWGQNA